MLRYVALCDFLERTLADEKRDVTSLTTVGDAKEEEIIGMFVSNATRGIRSRGRWARRRNSNPSISGQIWKIENSNGTYLA